MEDAHESPGWLVVASLLAVVVVPLLLFWWCSRPVAELLRDPSIRVFAENPCQRDVVVRFRYDDSTTVAAGGLEAIVFDVPAGDRAEGPRINPPAPPPSILDLEVYPSDKDPVQNNGLGFHGYEKLPPTETVEGDTALVLEVPQSACKP